MTAEKSPTRDALETLLASRAVRSSVGEWDAEAARTLHATALGEGWAEVGLDESLGGAGGAVVDACDVAAALAFRAFSSPVSDVAVVTNTLATRLGLRLPAGTPCVVAAAVAKRPGGGYTADRVPWASWATHVLALDTLNGTSRAAVVGVDDLLVRPGRTLSPAPSDHVELGSFPLDAIEVGGDASLLLWQLGALCRSVQIAAALERALELSVAYTMTRHQFGRALARQPVVQQELAALAGEVAAAVAAAGAAARAVAADQASSTHSSTALDREAARAVAAAKIRTGLAATSGARSAHQLHGAIGITREYELHAHSRSLWAWRDEYGTEREWSERLGAQIVHDGDVWESITGTPTSAAVLTSDPAEVTSVR